MKNVTKVYNHNTCEWLAVKCGHKNIDVKNIFAYTLNLKLEKYFYPDNERR